LAPLREKWESASIVHRNRQPQQKVCNYYASKPTAINKTVEINAVFALINIVI